MADNRETKVRFLARPPVYAPVAELAYALGLDPRNPVGSTPTGGTKIWGVGEMGSRCACTAELRVRISHAPPLAGVVQW